MKNNVEPFMIRFSSRRIVLAALKVFLVLGGILFIGWFIGAIPAYPHMREWKVCTYPNIISSSLFGIEKRQLFTAVCFNTTDTWKEVAAWYKPFGWTDANPVRDDYGIPIIGKINLGFAEILMKRTVLFSLYEPVDVRVVAEYEIRSKVVPHP